MPRCPKLVAVLPHDRCGGFKPNDDAAALIDISDSVAIRRTTSSAVNIAVM